MPKVVLDLRMVSGVIHGIARYALELARHLPALAPDWQFVGLVGPAGLPPGLGHLSPTVPLVRCPAGFLSPLEQPALAATLLATRPDLFHATSFSLPRFWSGRLVATLHDANHLALSQDYGRAQAAYYRWVVGPRAQRAAALITVSEFSRQALASHLGLSPYRFQVIAQGVDPSFGPRPASELEAFRQKWGLPPAYLALIGNPKRHKNLEVIGRLRAPLPYPVVTLAGKGAGRRLASLPQVIELNELPEEDMPLFYGAARALLFPSRYEGFGLPALEAMACRCPVVVAQAGSLPEVAGDAALVAHPDREEDWHDRVWTLHRDPSLRARLIELGAERAARFSWGSCARQTLTVYRRALGQL